MNIFDKLPPSSGVASSALLGVMVEIKIKDVCFAVLSVIAFVALIILLIKSKRK